MPYTAYDTDIFADYAVNTVCNRLVDALINQFNEEDALSEFLLSGCAARKMQEPTDDPRTEQVNFVTSSQKFYRYLAQNMGNILNGSTSIAYTDRIQVQVQGFNLEIWEKIGTVLEPVDYNGIKIETIEWISQGDPCTYDGNPVSSPVPITLAYPQKFGIGGNELYSQEFTFIPENQNLTWVQGDDVFDERIVKMKIKNYETDANFDRYANFRLNVQNNVQEGNERFSNFVRGSIDGAIAYDLSDGLSPDLLLEFINFRFLEPGDYATNIAFEVIGDDIISNINGALLEVYEYEIDLKVIGSKDVYVDPRAMAFNYVFGATEFIDLPIYVNIQGEYTLKYPKIITVTADGITDESTTNFSIKRATGPKTFRVSLNASIANADTSFVYNSIAIEHSGGTITVPVSILIAKDEGITVTPNQFFFEAVQGIEEAKGVKFSMTSNKVVSLTAPPWVRIQTRTGPFSPTKFSEGSVYVDRSNNFAPGVYKGAIVFTSEDGSSVRPITYTIKANSFTELISGGVNFAGDQVYVNLASNLRNVYLRSKLLITVYATDGSIQVDNFAFNEPIYKGKASFHPGSKVAAAMKSITDIDFYIPTDLASRVEKPFAYQRPARLDLTLEQRSYEDDSVKKSDTLLNMLFLKGTKPVNFYNNTGLTLSQYPVRVTRNSYGILNFIKSSGVHSIEIHLNGKLLRTVEHDTVQDSSFGMILSFMGFKEGDLVFVKVEDGSGGFFERKFYVFPENKESYHIAWTTEHEQLELMEFTGGLSFDTDYERIESTRYKNLVNTLDVLKTNRVQKLTANTGWVLKDNHLLIDSLLSAKRAWLFLPNTDYKIPLVPQSKKMSNYDSERTAYAFNVEFQINPKTDGKVYPR